MLQRCCCKGVVLVAVVCSGWYFVVTSVVLGVFLNLMRFYFFGSPEFVVKRDAFVAKFGFSLLFSHLKVSVCFLLLPATYSRMPCLSLFRLYFALGF